MCEVCVQVSLNLPGICTVTCLIFFNPTGAEEPNLTIPPINKEAQIAAELYKFEDSILSSFN